jgi:hypothetical protein
VTRLTAARTLAAVARARVPVPLASILIPATEELATYLRKTSRPLKLAAFSALTAIVTVPAYARRRSLTVSIGGDGINVSGHTGMRGR